jgi:hypothetical protein
MSNQEVAGLLASAQRGMLSSKGMSDGQVAHLMGLAPSTVHIDTALSNFLIRYDNRDYIADSVMPVVTVAKRSDKVFEFPFETMQQVAQAGLASNRARPNEVTYSVTTQSYSVSDYGLIDFVSADEEQNADAPLQPRLVSAEIVMNFLMLARELRVATVAFGSGNYTGQTSALSGGNRWDTSTGTPVQDILSKMESPLALPNTLTMGGQVWPYFRNNTEVKSYITGRASTTLGDVPFLIDADTVARAFGLEKVVVGRARYNSAREGATVVSSYVWGKSAALTRTESQPNARKTQCFGLTYRFGQIQNQVIPELLAGRAGGVYVKITHADAEVAVGLSSGAQKAGYLLTTVIS